MWFCRSEKQWTICWIWAITPMLSSLNRIKTPSLAICQVRAKEKHVVQWRAITLSWWVKNHSFLIRFLQMVYAENCKKQNSSSFFNGGASSPCSASRTRFIKVTACLYLTVFFLRLASKIMALFSACCPLSGSLHLGYRNGNGATHWPILSKQNT